MLAKRIIPCLDVKDGRVVKGTRFTDLEEVAVQVGNLLAREVLHVALKGQANSPLPDDLTACPSCEQALGEWTNELRETQARPGDLAWHEPAAYCPRCRRAFFPSGQEPGT